MANGSVSGVSYLIAASAGALLGGAGMWWWAKRQQAASQQGSLSGTPTTQQRTIMDTTTVPSKSAPTTPQRSTVSGNAAVTRHALCTPYDENQQAPSSLSAAALRIQDIWNDRALMNADWFTRIKRIVADDLDAIHAPADPNLQGRAIGALISAHVEPVSNSLDQYHYFQQLARKLEVLAGHCAH